MKIKIIQIGKTKEKFVEEGINKYLKLLSPYCAVEIITIKEVKITETFTAEKSRKEECAQIFAKICAHDFNILLDEKGEDFSSLSFASFLQKTSSTGQTLTFIIGGPYGFDSKIKNHAHKVFSLSKMTFTHELCRLILLEQLYRGICIIRGKEYHNR